MTRESAACCSIWRTRGLTDEFLVIWATDQGDMNGDHYLWRKGYPWEAIAHVSIVVRPPGGTEVRESDAIVEIRDVVTTIYDALFGAGGGEG